METLREIHHLALGNYRLATPIHSVVSLRLGLDLGSRNLGWALIGLGEDGLPVQILGMGVIVHDGAIGDAKKQETRKSQRSKYVANRIMRQRRNERLAKLDAYIKEIGLDITMPEKWSPDVAPWAARVVAADPIEDLSIAKAAIAQIVRHTARHAAWRNPWWSFDRLWSEYEGLDPRGAGMRTDEASSTLLTTGENRVRDLCALPIWNSKPGSHRTRFRELINSFGSRREGFVPKTLGEVFAFYLFADHSDTTFGTRGLPNRLRSGEPSWPKRNKGAQVAEGEATGSADKSGAKETFDLKATAKVMSDGSIPQRLRQLDFLSEFMWCWEQQSTVHPEVFTPERGKHIAGLMFERVAPGVIEANIGECTLGSCDEDGVRALRAPKWHPAANEFRLLQQLLNLRIAGPDGTRPLRSQEIAILESKFGSLTKPAAEFGEIEEWLQLAEDQELRHADRAGTHGDLKIDLVTAPLQTAAKELGLPFGKWWANTSSASRTEFLRKAAECNYIRKDGLQDRLLDELSSLIAESEEWVGPHVERAALLELIQSLPAGRTQFGVPALDALNGVMREFAENNVDGEARFDLNAVTEELVKQAKWSPPIIRPGKDIRHPGVAVGVQLVVKLVDALNARYPGMIHAVNLEAPRHSGLKLDQLQKEINLISKRRERREAMKSQLIERGIANPSNDTVDRHLQFELQNGACAYCGVSYGRDSQQLNDPRRLEWEHVVPRAGGGGNKKGNLVLACRECNKEKGNRTLASWKSQQELEAIAWRMFGELKAKNSSGKSVSILPLKLIKRMQNVTGDGKANEHWTWPKRTGKPDAKTGKATETAHDWIASDARVLAKRIFQKTKDTDQGRGDLEGTGWVIRETARHLEAWAEDHGQMLDIALLPLDAIVQARQAITSKLPKEVVISKDRSDRINHGFDGLLAALVDEKVKQPLLLRSQIAGHLRSLKREQNLEEVNISASEIAAETRAQVSAGKRKPMTEGHLLHFETRWLPSAAATYESAEVDKIVPYVSTRSRMTGQAHADTIVRLSRAVPLERSGDPVVDANADPLSACIRLGDTWAIAQQGVRERLVSVLMSRSNDTSLSDSTVWSLEDFFPEGAPTFVQMWWEKFGRLVQDSSGRFSGARLMLEHGHILVRNGQAKTASNEYARFVDLGDGKNSFMFIVQTCDAERWPRSKEIPLTKELVASASFRAIPQNTRWRWLRSSKVAFGPVLRPGTMLQLESVLVARQNDKERLAQGGTCGPELASELVQIRGFKAKAGGYKWDASFPRPHLAHLKEKGWGAEYESADRKASDTLELGEGILRTATVVVQTITGEEVRRGLVDPGAHPPGS